MPTTYAHWRFGCDCIEVLPEDVKKAIDKNRAIFDLGVHGPDIFFYDLKHPELPEYGSHMHTEPGSVFFGRCLEVYRNNAEDKEAMLAYIFGFLSHYAVDSQAHSYVGVKDASCDRLTHNKIEAEYDAYLMKKDGRSVNQTKRSTLLKPDRNIARIIARFYPFSEKEMYRGLIAQKLIISFFNSRLELKRKSFDRILRKAKKPDYADLFVYPYESELCADSNLRLDKLKDNALTVYKELSANLYDALNGKTQLCEYFDRFNFDPEPDERTFVLPYEEEKNYIPEILR